MKRFRNIPTQLRNLFLILILALGQATTAVGPFLQTQKAAAAEVCVNDTAGPNDEPGQKDLTRMCSDTASTTSISVSWQWDEIKWNGNNTGDACSLFDTDNDGNANYSVCVTIGGNAIQQANSPRIYTCGDDAPEKCTQPIGLVPGPYTNTSCAVSVPNTGDPFATGDEFPKDAVAICTIALSDVGGEDDAVLIDVCSYPSQQPNSDPSDCIIFQTRAGKLEVKKAVIPSTDNGFFNLLIDSVVQATDVQDGGSTGEKTVSVAQHTVSETAGTGTSLTDYTSNIVCRDNDGLGDIVAQSATTTVNVTVADNDDIVCIVTNTRQTGTITLIKNVINNNGGTAGVNDFGLSIGGTSVTSGQTLTLTPGSYATNESGLSGYSFVSITGTGCPAVLGGNVTLANNQNITCTITNDDQAGQIRVVKSVTNDNGGNAAASDFQLYVNGLARNQNQYYSANAGTYTVTEDNVAGYTKTSTTCVNDANQQSVSHPVNLALGQSVTCTVVNDDIAPRLILVKNVTNDNGGTILPAGFQLTLNGNNAAQNTALPGISSNTTYTVSEVAKAGYAGTNVTCVDDDTLLQVSTSASSSGTVSLNEGQRVTCTVYNNDIAPKLTVVKTVTNNDGGTLAVGDFPLFVGAVQVVSGVQNEFNAGVYVVSETNQPGYTASGWGLDCDLGGNITLAIGGVYTCTITNNDQPATIIVDKVVINDDGGTANDDAWTLLVNQTQVVDEAVNTFNGNVLYTISEQNGPSGYIQTSLTCQDVTNTQVPVNVAHPFTAQLGHTYRCTITNNDQPANLTLIKTVTNDNGGTATQNLWTLTATGPEVLSGQDATASPSTGVSGQVNAGTYTLSESGGPSGYTASSWSCTGTGLVQNGSSVTLSLNANVTCTINNNDQPATLVLVKNLPNDNGGTATQNDFPVFITGQAAAWGNNSVSAGSYTVSETTLPGYQPSTWGRDCDANGNVTLPPGETKTCVITNDDIPPSLTLVKTVTNNNGGTRGATEWNLTATGSLVSPTNLSGAGGATSGAGFKADTYTLDETGPTDYTEGTWSCTNSVTVNVNNQITLTNGQSTTCTINNDDKAPSLTLNKIVSNANGGNAVESSWTLTATGPTTLTGPGAVGSADVVSGAGFSAGTYTLSESTGPTGYTASAWTCTNNVTVNSDSQITLVNNQTTVCSITNSDIAPRLTLDKNVTNNNGGNAVPAEWTLTATPTSGTVISGNGNNGVENVTAKSNVVYTLTESGPSGYTVSVDWTCNGGVFDAAANTVLLNEGENVTCQITNDDVAPELTLLKIVVDEHGDTAVASDWTLTATPTSGTAISGNGANGVVNQAAVSNVEYTLSENGPSGYTASAWNCDGQGDFSFDTTKLTLTEGADVTCVITNTSEAPSLVVIKTVVNDNGGSAVSSDFTMHVTGTDVSDNEFPGAADPGTTVTLDEGAYGVTEDEVNGYAVSYGEGCNGTAAVGEVDICIVTNNDVAPQLTVIKNVINDNSGTNVAADFTMNVAATNVSDNSFPGSETGTTVTLNAGAYTVTENMPVGSEYTATLSADCVGTIALGQTKTCTITNNDVPHPLVQVVKSGPATASPGDAITYTFTVTNIGDTPLNIVTVNDNVAGDGVYQSGDTDDDGLLDLTETWIYTVQYTIPANQDSNIDNTVTVCVEDQVCDTDDHHLVVLAKVIVTKYNDYNQNGQRDDGEPVLPGWNFTLEGSQECENLYNLLVDAIIIDAGCDEFSDSFNQTTGEDGTTTFNNVHPFVNYELSETLQESWHQSNIHCDNEQNEERGNVVEENGYYVYAQPGETINCFVGNYRDLVLNISKANNRPNPTTVGDTVTYSIFVSVPEDSGVSYSTTVVDLPPENFTYVPGSWTAVSSVRGDIKAAGITTEPTYASPGTWILGTMLPGEIVTLTYRAVISTVVSAGTYPDVAFAQGCGLPATPCIDEEVVFSNLTFAGEPFVSTAVTIVSPQVLGASTTVLVDTGTTTGMLAAVMTATALLGVTILVARRRPITKGGRK